MRVVRKDQELTSGDRSEYAVECRFLGVAYDDSGADDVDAAYACGEALGWGCQRDSVWLPWLFATSKAVKARQDAKFRLTVFSHFRNKAFLPISYSRKDFPIPHSI